MYWLLAKQGKMVFFPLGLRQKELFPPSFGFVVPLLSIKRQKRFTHAGARACLTQLAMETSSLEAYLVKFLILVRLKYHGNSPSLCEVRITYF